MGERYKIEFSVKESDIGSVFDMLRFDGMEVLDVEIKEPPSRKKKFVSWRPNPNLKKKDNIINIEAEGRNFTERRWKSFGISPRLVSLRYVSDKKFKNYSFDEREVCVENIEGREKTRGFLKLLNFMAIKDFEFGHLVIRKIDDKEFWCLGVGGERDKIDEELSKLDSEKMIAYRK